MKANDLNDLLGREVTRKDLYLKEVAIADGVENICSHCLLRIRRMTTLIIPSSVMSIDSGAFRGCRNLTTLSIPESVSKISPLAFCGGCDSLESIVVDKNNKYFDSRDNCNAIVNSSTDTIIFKTKGRFFIL